MTARWLEYELDVAKIIAFPAMSDGRQPLTAAFLRAKRIADGLRPASAKARLTREQLAEYRNAVADFEVAFDVAERDARRIKDSSFTEVERKRLDTAKQLLTVAIDQAATPAERQLAYRRVREELDGLISLSDEAIEVLETKVMLEITTGTVPQPTAPASARREPPRRRRRRPGAAPPRPRRSRSPAARPPRDPKRRTVAGARAQHRHRARPRRAPQAAPLTRAQLAVAAAVGADRRSAPRSTRRCARTSRTATPPARRGPPGSPTRGTRQARIVMRLSIGSARQMSPSVTRSVEPGVRDEDDVGLARRRAPRARRPAAAPSRA